MEEGPKALRLCVEVHSLPKPPAPLGEGAMKTFSSLPLFPPGTLRGTWGVQMGIGTPPLIVPRRYAGLDDGLRLMVAVLDGNCCTDLPINSGSAKRLTVEEGRLD